MSDDLVERLLENMAEKLAQKDDEIERLKNALYEFVGDSNEARDEIERLRAELAAANAREVRRLGND